MSEPVEHPDGERAQQQSEEKAGQLAEPEGAEFAALWETAQSLVGIGRDADALTAFRTAAQYAAAHFSDDDPRRRQSNLAIGDALLVLGDRQQAIEAYTAALAEEQRFAPLTPRTAELASELGSLCDESGDFLRAHSLHLLSFSIRQQTLGPLDEETNRSRYEVGELSRVLFWWDEAKFFLGGALDAAAAAHRPMSEFYAKIQNNLAEVLIRTGEAPEALGLLNNCLQFRTLTYGEDSERVDRTNLTLAAYYLAMKEPDKALLLAHQGLLKNPGLAMQWLLPAARATLALNNYKQSQEYAFRLIGVFERKNLTSFVILRTYLQVLCILLRASLALQDLEAAQPALAGLPEFMATAVLDLIQTSSEGLLLAFLREALIVRDLWLTRLARVSSPAASEVQEAFRFVQQLKGLRSRYMRWRLPGDGSALRIEAPREAQARQEILEEMARLKAELRAETDLNDPHARREQLGRRVQLNALERELAEQISDREILTDFQLTDLCGLLPANTRLLEFVQLGRVEEIGEAERYGAFVLAAGGINYSECGLCNGIDKAVEQMRASLVGEKWTQETRPPAWVRLSRFLGSKLLDLSLGPTAEKEHLIICPDGTLGSLPFELLTLASTEWALDRVSVSYLLRAGELAELDRFRSAGTEPLILAAPDFDLPGAFVGVTASVGDVESIFHRTMEQAGTRFGPLPGAAVEAATIAGLLGVEPVQGPWALVSELMRSHSPEIVHISTHGFCLPYAATLDQVQSSTGATGNQVDLRMLLADPMQRSGLALSGANAMIDGRSLPIEAGKGVLIAADIEQLDLQNTDLVVLSACRSGLGDLTLEDGAHGLRRAFFVAGCRSIVSALWDVPDSATRDLFVIFYERLLAGHSRLEALQGARSALRARYPHDPIYWAGFVLDGSCGPLARFNPVEQLRITTLSMKAWLAEAPAVSPPDAVSVLRRSLLMPEQEENSRLHNLLTLGDLANRLGLHQEAITYFEKALLIPTIGELNRTLVVYDIAKTKHQIGKLEEAILDYSTLMQDKLDSVLRATIQVNRGVAYMVLDRDAEALVDFDAVIETPNAPANQKAMARKNRSNIHQGDPARALDDIHFSLAYGPDSPEEALMLQYNRIDLLIRLDRRPEAIQQWQSLDRDVALPAELRTLLDSLKQKLP